ncbi:MAG: hypothetical protein ACK44W_10410, partial [Planctomycetota bacterium]
LAPISPDAQDLPSLIDRAATMLSGAKSAAEVLEARDRSRAGANVPAKGLTLVEVRYDGCPRKPPADKRTDFTRPGAGTA